MKYYATVKHHSISGTWEELPSAKSLTHAKRLASARYGQGYIGHVVNVVGCPEEDYKSGRINDVPAHRKVIGKTRWVYFSRAC
jgi:hypothetical protein